MKLTSQWEPKLPMRLEDLRIYNASQDGLERHDCVDMTCQRCGPVRGVRTLEGAVRCRKCGRRHQEAA